MTKEHPHVEANATGNEQQQDNDHHDHDDCNYDSGGVVIVILTASANEGPLNLENRDWGGGFQEGGFAIVDQLRFLLRGSQYCKGNSYWNLTLPLLLQPQVGGLLNY